MKCLTNEGVQDEAQRLIGATSRAWAEGVFKSYLTVNGGSATPARADGRGSD